MNSREILQSIDAALEEAAERAKRVGRSATPREKSPRIGVEEPSSKFRGAKPAKPE